MLMFLFYTFNTMREGIFGGRWGLKFSTHCDILVLSPVTASINGEIRIYLVYCRLLYHPKNIQLITGVFSDVNKDLGLKAKDSDPKAKAKAKDLGPKAKAKDSRYQGPIFHRSSLYIICSSLTLCACFYVRVLHFVSL